MENPEDLQRFSDVPNCALPLGLHCADLSSVNDWIVKLQFQTKLGIAYGSGFFLNIPGASHDVILTTAHNLIGATAITVSDLKVLLASGPVSVTNFRVSTAYKANQTPAADYGAILLPRSSTGGVGFGYNMELADKEHFPAGVCVSGYRVDTAVGRPLTSSGSCVSCYAEQLEYRASLEHGMSGSPVWTECQGLATVVAIHNRRPNSPRAGSRGARLTPALLREVFSWVSVGECGVMIRVRNTRPMRGPSLPPEGLYLHFPENLAVACVRLGSGTVFAVIPAYVTPHNVLYALAVGKKWVMFKPARKEVLMTEKINAGCLFKKCHVNEKAKAMRIVVENQGIKFQLRVQTTKNSGEDVENFKVSMAVYPMQNTEMFTQFWFE